jgi:hypothetical protein
MQAVVLVPSTLAFNMLMPGAHAFDPRQRTQSLGKDGVSARRWWQSIWQPSAAQRARRPEAPQTATTLLPPMFGIAQRRQGP